MRKSTGYCAGVLAIAAVAVVIAGCDGGTSSPSTASSTSTSTVPTDRAKAPLTIAGDHGLAGGLSGAEVTCSFPDVDGLTISVFAQASNPAYSYRIAVRGDRVFVHVDSGAGTTFRERNFQGTGVSGFDAAQGARVDAQLTETTPTQGVDAGSIGTISAMKGSIDCGDQTPGTSTIAVSGDTPTGRYEAARLDPVVVECYSTSGQVTAIGTTAAGATKVLLMVSLDADGNIGVEEIPPSAVPRYYGSAPGSATLDSAGGRADGDVVEKDAATPHTLHVAGDARCGTPIRD